MTYAPGSFEYENGPDYIAPPTIDDYTTVFKSFKAYRRSWALNRLECRFSGRFKATNPRQPFTASGNSQSTGGAHVSTSPDFFFQISSYSHQGRPI